MIAKHLISETLFPLKTTDTGGYALSMMDDLKVSHLPVVSNMEYLGLVSDADILAMNNPEESLGSSALTMSKVSVQDYQHVYDVIKVFSSGNLSLLPVLNEKNIYIGSILLQDLVHKLSEIIAIDNPGGIIILEMNDKDYLLTEIAQIVESNDAKILSLYLTSHPDSTKLEVTVKVNRIDIGAILQTFTRYNYTIKASFTENTYDDGLQERFDSFMKYLNV
jgi:acetoin utilization protein AcuB